MENIELNAYISDVFKLVRTMVIKIEAIAKRDNEMLLAANYPVSDNKRTWRYYMNLNGDYHPTDDLMWVVSLDTGEEIIFNKENLEVHLATKREYASGGYWFNRLTETYPHQTDLIRGILSPIPYTETIPAKDFTILRYNSDYVSWNEDQLIPELQRWIDSEVNQTFKTEYLYTDDLMLPAMIMNLYAGLIQAIHTIRMEAIGTRYVCDFHLWSRIDSYGNFSQYKNSLDNFQKMWLYRNMSWIRDNPGQQYTFNMLLGNLLTHREIPLGKFDMVETTETQLDDYIPTPMYRQLWLNLQDDYGKAATFVSTDTLINKEVPLARDNTTYEGEYLQDATVKGEISLHSVLPTKALISTMRDYTNRHSDTLMSVSYNEWVYLTGIGLYSGTVSIVNPKTGKSYRVTTAEAHDLWVYLSALSQGIRLEYVCPSYYQRAMRNKLPTVDELVSLGYRDIITPKIAGDIRKNSITYSKIVSPESLAIVAKEVYDCMWKHKKTYSQFYDLNKRAEIKNACDAMYVSGYVKLSDWETYDALLEHYELNFDDYDPEELQAFAWEIFKSVTGFDISQSPSMRTIQQDLIEMMLKLSSYTIHIIKEMDDGTDVIELINEIFVGDSTLSGGGGNSMVGDFSGVMLDDKGHIDGEYSLSSTTVVNDNYKPSMVISSDGIATFKDNNVFKTVVIEQDLMLTAVRIQDRSYIQPAVIEDTVLPSGELGIILLEERKE